MARIEACVFDAYGTLFDVQAAARHLAARLGDRWQPLAEVWRAKQLQYTWLRALMGRYVDFWQVTGEALDHALDAVGLADAGLREELMGLYARLDAYPEVPQVLEALRARGLRLAILSNGAPEMLASAVEAAGVGGLLDAVLSVDEVGTYKPHPSVYRLAVDRFGLPAERMGFVSSNGWDAHAAKAFGYRVVWCNRHGLPRERIPQAPDAEVRDLTALPDVLEGLA
ncbi:haloacid dehalogenase type II [Inmirania thermothiophila]|uniref:(S)-2-haloacid dehalogenase n=1 Tax=Inmirania thermothiophila TaxID=1750597 RepID=A0A3N1Y6V6_9GAMM|nr:haloacid dehalogenase type II [Inmirania thermothiophila]ROR34554.1 2-haloacid dehalogenase [Inmirania thermothiophila]